MHSSWGLRAGQLWGKAKPVQDCLSCSGGWPGLHPLWSLFAVLTPATPRSPIPTPGFAQDLLGIWDEE